jgi:hypothetical protein
MLDPVPPIFVFSRDNDADLVVFEELSDAEVDLEPIDVNNNEFEIFDAAGHLLHASVQRRRTKISVQSEEKDASALRSRLATFFATIGLSLPAGIVDWDEYITEAASKIRSWSQR